MAAAEHQRAYTYIKAGDKSSARQVLRQALDRDPNDLKGWLLMARAADTRQQRADALYHVLDIDPGHPQAAEALSHMGLDPRKAKRGGAAALAPKAKHRSSSNNGPVLIVIGIVVGIIVLGVVGLIVTANTVGVSMGNAWTETLSELEAMGEGFTMTFEGSVSDYQGSIALGDAALGAMPSFNDTNHLYTYEGRVGEVRTFTVTARDGNFDPMLRVLDPNGNLIAENDDIAFPDNINAQVVVTLPMDGTYSLIVGEFGFDGGAYQVNVQ